jgi:GDP/UDP-N,N'-diacetylbacillosamine 2-epimerase (hydrolysing)
VLEALLDFDLPVWIGSPNSDPGSEAVREANVDFCRRFPHRFRSYGNLPRPLFAQLLGGAAALIGNSSCGVIEAPFLGVPVVDLGRRQAGRDGSERLIHAPYDREAIAAAIHRALTAAAQPRPSPGGSAYGDGRAGPRIARLLAEIPLGARLLDKRETTGDSR